MSPRAANPSRSGTLQHAPPAMAVAWTCRASAFFSPVASTASMALNMSAAQQRKTARKVGWGWFAGGIISVCPLFWFHQHWTIFMLDACINKYPHSDLWNLNGNYDRVSYNVPYELLGSNKATLITVWILNIIRIVGEPLRMCIPSCLPAVSCLVSCTYFTLRTNCEETLIALDLLSPDSFLQLGSWFFCPV